MLIVVIACGVGAVMGALVWWARARRFASWQSAELDVAYDEVHYLTTVDGWRLAVYRYCVDVDTGVPTPILLCHGLGLNHRHLDLGRGRSLARWLRARGRDVWLVDLRTTHTATWTGVGALPPLALDQLVEHDARAAIERVLACSGASAIDWLGFSFGGVVGAAVAGGRLGGAIRSLALVAPPFDLRAAPALTSFLCATRWLARGSVLSLRAWSRRVAGARRLGARVAATVRTRANLARDVGSALAFVAVEDVDVAMRDVVSTWARTNGAPTSSRGVDYLARASATARPLWLVAGTGDGIAPPESVAALARVWGGEVSLRVVGAGACEVAGGLGLDAVEAFETDSGWAHLDLISGERAPGLVWYPLLAFLERLDDAELAAETWRS